MNSIWPDSSALPFFPSLKEDCKTEVAIIGGGITGILCAYFLQQMGIDYILLEKDTICSGVTGNTTAKLTAQHGLIYQKLFKHAGSELTKMYLDANLSALSKYSELCRHIDCDFETQTNYVYSKESLEELEKEADALQKIGFRATLTETPGLPFETRGAVAFPNQAQFHPLKFLSHIAGNLKIYEHSFVRAFYPKKVVTDEATVTADNIIFTTHFPIDNKHGLYFLKMYQYRSYVIALENAFQHAPGLQGMYLDAATGGISLRNYKNLLLIGGAGHRSGKTSGNWQTLRSFADRYYPGAAEQYNWAAQDCMTLDGVPYIGPYSPNMPGCFVATGFNKWGMTSSMAAAMLLTDLILEKENPYLEVFSPSRSMLKPQLFINAGEAVKNLLTISDKRCPHMGCALKYNSAEHSWDCPCHGSRFAKDGSLLDNPANGNLPM